MHVSDLPRTCLPCAWAQQGGSQSGSLAYSGHQVDVQSMADEKIGQLEAQVRELLEDKQTVDPRIATLQVRS